MACLSAILFVSGCTKTEHPLNMSASNSFISDTGFFQVTTSSDNLNSGEILLALNSGLPANCYFWISADH